MSGPNVAICRGSDTLRAICDAGDFAWMAPQEAPAESVLRATEEIGEFPVLATTGDHALLRPQTVDQFIADAGSSPADAQVGLVPYDRVLQRFPGAKRTRLRFRDGGFCGSNLFLFRNAKALGAVRFWSTVQRDRKRPWRIARRLGAGVMLRYLVGRLAIDSAFSVLSRVAGCHITWVEVEDERAAVDVDTVQDLALAERILG